jgi:hypothetical protein
MPCGDITEKIELSLGFDNKIDSYRFSKKTCGGAIGMETLLHEYVKGRDIESIIDQNEFGFLQANFAADEIDEFLRVKHFLAIKSVLNVYLGNSPGGVDDSCTIASIEYIEDKIIIRAEINSDLIVDQISACDHCGPD